LSRASLGLFGSLGTQFTDKRRTIVPVSAPRKPTESDEMDNEGRLTHPQRRVIPFLLASASIEEACRRAKINKSTVYEWLKGENFRRELKRERNAVIERALDSLKANTDKATKTLVRHLDSERENISLRAAEASSSLRRRHLSTNNWKDASKRWKTASDRRADSWLFTRRHDCSIP
jgi:hypothetical protein